MKKLFTIIGAALLSSTIFAQNLYVHQNDGTADSYDVANIDSIGFELGKSKLAESPVNSDCEKNLKDPYFLLDAIDRILQEKENQSSLLRDSLDKLKNTVAVLNTELASVRNQLANCQSGYTCVPDTNAVDLGLSVRWSTMNVGATSERDLGNHYSWGEVSPVDDVYDYDGWSASKLIEEGIMSADSTLTPEHDAATVNMGECWRMPTAKEVQELYQKCTWRHEPDLFGVEGYVVTGPTGNSIFIPAVGVKKGANDKVSIGDGYCWTSTFSPVSDVYADSFVLFSDGTLTLHWKHTRYDGVVIRPVWNGK